LTVLLAYDPAMAAYRFGDQHPMRPERFTLAVELMHSWNLVTDALHEDPGETRAIQLVPMPASEEDLLLAHSASYVKHVIAASRSQSRASGHGIGYGDTPAFANMHETTSLIVGGTMYAVDSVLNGDAERAFAPAGGLHHAQHDHASGFCVYNDLSVAIEHATRSHEGLRVAYIDVDAHHGDGVESAFYERADVLTLSVHESGRYLFPGSGRATDIGLGPGAGTAVNVPLPPDAGPAAYQLVLAEVIAPALTRFAPDLLVAQIGADSHFGDPLTHLRQTISGFYDLVGGILDLADELTGGRIVLTGGGGYQPFSAVPRMWAGAMALLLGSPVPKTLPEAWVTHANDDARAAGHDPTEMDGTWVEDVPDIGEERRATAMQATRYAVESVKKSSPLLGE
jgi:acetoin utilization protein AcuC